MEAKVGRNNMKIKKMLNIVFIGLISIMLFPFSVSAMNISTINVVDNNNKFTVSGTTEDGVLAIVALVYSNNNLSHMESCSVNSNTYNCELSKTFEIGSYTIKVADYDGGNYITKDITIVAPQQPNPGTNPITNPETNPGTNPITNPETNPGTNPITNPETNPQTLDGITLYIGLGFISIIGLTGTCLYTKKKELN